MTQLFYDRAHDYLFYSLDGGYLDAETLEEVTLLPEVTISVFTVTPDQNWPNQIAFVSTNEGYLILSAPEDQYRIELSYGDLDSPIRTVHLIRILGHDNQRPFNQRLLQQLRAEVGRPLSQIGRPAEDPVTSLRMFLDINTWGPYYVVNNQFYYDADTLELTERGGTLVELAFNRFPSTNPILLITTDPEEYYVLDSDHIREAEGIPQEVFNLQYPNIEQIAPGAPRLPSANLPDFDEDVDMAIHDLVRNRRPMSQLFQEETLESIQLAYWDLSPYYIINGRYYYGAEDLKRVEIEDELTIADLPHFETQPALIIFEADHQAVDSNHIDTLPRNSPVESITLLLFPDLEGIIPGSAELPPATLPQFNPELYDRIEELSEKGGTLSELRISSNRQKKFQEDYLNLLKSLYGLL